MIITENYNSYMIGDKDGFVYEISDKILSDRDGGKNWLTSYPADDTQGYSDIDFFVNESGIKGFIETADYELNDTRHTFRLLETLFGIFRKSEGAVSVRCSVDMGANWTSWQSFNLTDYGLQYQTNVDEYTEIILNWMSRGSQVRFQITNSNAGWTPSTVAINQSFYPFEIESLTIAYNDVDQGIMR